MSVIQPGRLGQPDQRDGPVATSSILAPTEWSVDESFEPLTNEKVIGLNNLLNIAWLNRGLQLAAPVARVVTPDGPGTGYLIGTDLLITNHHVLPNEGITAGSSAEFNYQVNWEGRLEPVRRFTFDTSRFRTSVELDYTIVQVRDAPGNLFGYVDLDDRADVAVNDFVNIIQHPLGGPKQISFTDNKVAAVFGHLFQYSTDTEPGSSGSPVFNQSWQIVGLHHKGGGLAGPDGQKHFTNEGILIGALLRDAAQFLGLTDALYDLAFGELRAGLVALVDTTEPPSDPNAVATDLLRTHPRFSFALDEWAKVNARPEDSPTAALAGAGIAVGAALAQWSRSSGHESIAAVAPSTPAPADALVALVGRFKGSNTVPSDVYATVLAGVQADATLVAPAVERVGTEVGPLAAAHAFLIGVTMGGAAYDRGPAPS